MGPANGWQSKIFDSITQTLVIRPKVNDPYLSTEMETFTTCNIMNVIFQECKKLVYACLKCREKISLK